METELEHDANESDDFHDLQAAHSTKIANHRYGRTGAKFNGQILSQFREVSDKWQGWLGLISRQSKIDESVSNATVNGSN
jgi:hypothetical protein